MTPKRAHLIYPLYILISLAEKLETPFDCK